MALVQTQTSKIMSCFKLVSEQLLALSSTVQKKKKLNHLKGTGIPNNVPAVFICLKILLF